MKIVVRLRFFDESRDLCFRNGPPLNTDRRAMIKKDHRSAINIREDKCMGIYSTGRFLVR